ncbi:MAG: tetratricopeptide repeat protein [Deltaproteobacteria bacterium]|nr:tetratricopeptide repeat protein [Deltaproteobacteria bacterium]
MAEGDVNAGQCGCGGRCAKWGAAVSIVIALGVLLPLGIMAWNSVVDHHALGSAACRHEDKGDKAFSDRDYPTSIAAYVRSRAARDSLGIQLKIARARAFLVAIQPGLIGAGDVADLEYERTWLLDSDSTNAATYLAVGGHMAALKGDVEAANKAYQEAIAKQPDNAGAHLGLAIQAYQKGDRAKAQTEFAAVLAKVPDHVEALIGLGDVKLASGETDTAVDSYQKALKLRQDARAHHGLGVALLNKRQPQEAAAEFQRSINLNPKSYDSYVALGNLLLNANALPQAERAFRAAAELRQDEVSLSGLAAALNAMNRPGDAIQVVAPLLQARTAGPASMLQGARAAEMLGRKEDAMALYSEVQRVVGQAGEQMDKQLAEAFIAQAKAGAERVSGAAPAPAPAPAPGR